MVVDEDPGFAAGVEETVVVHRIFDALRGYAGKRVRTRNADMYAVRISEAIGDIRASVYRMAAGGRPAIDPKLPCLSTSTCRMFQSCAMRTKVG